MIKKFILFIRREGLFASIKRSTCKVSEVAHKVPYLIKEVINYGKYNQIVCNSVKDKNVYILIPGIDWNIKLFQRPHQIATALSKYNNTHVFFVSDGYKYDYFSGLLKINDNLTVITKTMFRHCGNTFDYASKRVIFKCWPNQMDLLQCVRNYKLVYEYIDDLSIIYYLNKKETEDNHKLLISKADLTVCTAKSLYEDSIKYSKKVLYSPNAGDYDFFHEHISDGIINTVKEKTARYKCILGYYGCFAEWFDYDIIKNIAEKRKDICFVLVGYKFDSSFEKFSESIPDNVFYFSEQPYEKLPVYLNSFDIALIPFKINNITNSTSPVKLFEYMAAGKPVLSALLPECVQYQSVITYINENDFMHKMDFLINRINDADLLKIIDKEARANTWAKRCSEILDILQE